MVYRVVYGKPTCNHRREVFRFSTDGRVEEFCSECKVVYVYYPDDPEFTEILRNLSDELRKQAILQKELRKLLR